MLIVIYLAVILGVLRLIGIQSFASKSMCIFAVLSTRPNLIGEVVGIVSPIFWIGLMILVRNQSVNSRIRSLREIRTNGISKILAIMLAYWCLTFISANFHDQGFGYWPPIANLGTLAISLTAISYLYSKGELQHFLLVFASLISFEGISGLISSLVLRGLGCQNLQLGRNWSYELCPPGGVFVGERLTGIGGEPAIFASYCILSITLFISVTLPRWTKSLGIAGCLSGLVLSGSSTGYVLLPISVLLTIILLKGSFFKKAVGSYFLILILLLAYTLLIRTADRFLLTKSISNRLSITDRGLDVPFGEYMQSWRKGLFYNGSPFNANFSAISILRESLSQGFWVVGLFLLLIVYLGRLSRNSMGFIVTSVPIIVTTFVSEPFWANAFWIVIMTAIALNIRSSSETDT